MFEVEITTVECIDKNSIPDEDINIIYDLSLSSELKYLTSVEIYFRYGKDCNMFNRSNWIIDLHLGQRILCVRLPSQMNEEQVIKFAQPLFDHLNREKNKNRLKINKSK